MQDPLGVGQRLVEKRQILKGHRVDQSGPGPLAAQLDEIGALGVAIAGGALGVDGHRPGPGRERLDDTLEGIGCVGDRRERFAETEQRWGSRLRGVLF
jgi:hypothetical protein